jgi:hypothetical protein
LGPERPPLSVPQVLATRRQVTRAIRDLIERNDPDEILRERIRGALARKVSLVGPAVEHITHPTREHIGAEGFLQKFVRAQLVFGRGAVRAVLPVR